MSEATVRKPSANKNIRKLRAVSMVCSLTSSWQQWVSENEEKQAKEPSGWAPDSDAPREQRRAGPEEKRARSSQAAAAAAASTPARDASSLGPPPGSQAGEKTPGEAKIKSKQVVKSVSSSAQEKGMGVGFLTDRYGKDVDEVDRILNMKVSPTRRRKCSNLVSELTKSWKDAEVERDEPQKTVNERSLENEASSDATVQTEQGRQKEGDGDIVDQKAESCSRIKRPSTTVVNKDIDEVKKLTILSKKFSPVGNLKSKWQNWASEHTINQKLNPFSDDFDYNLSMSTRLHKGEEGYGRPKEGTKTAERARRAEAHIHREIDDMCFIIRTMADPDPDGLTRVTFGELFDRYVRISDKVVGILMRARKHGKVAFEGEMLWQGQDDYVIITLLV
ncbi:hypothetical protein AAFF_G00165950 [Aldrovandia affinis]|uniref:Actin-binding Rho-activating protein n=1 Tax=Aldrovandia affinis TaxID=143900 RepID=A0AAD7RMI2_9TELE|nr:hypothetical protein AAFF_G00165950 [Aldrovandia affinis]